jgi:diguanylate cyclase (GGDEF)-like protein
MSDDEVPAWHDLEALAVRGRIDQMTGITSRYGIEQFLAGRERECVGVVLADLDRFQYVNHERGHAVGDQVLIEVARRIEAASPPGVFAARFGGDEFAYFLPGIDDMSEVQSAALTMLRTSDTPIVAGEVSVTMHLSVGVAIAPVGDLMAGLMAADTAMYEAKRRGGGRAVCLEPAWEAN